MKSTKKVTFYISLILFLILQIPMIKANPVLPSFQFISVFYIVSCIFGFVGTIICEFFIGSLMIHDARKYKPFFFKVIFSINSITFPVTQLVVYFFMLSVFQIYIVYMILLIEIFVIVSEWLLINLILKKGRGNNILGESNSRSHLFLYSIIANMITYFIGVLIVYNLGGGTVI